MEFSHSILQTDDPEQRALVVDPSNRQPRAYYTMKYQEIAEHQLDHALSIVNKAVFELGEAGWNNVLAQNKPLAVLVADSRLARDTLQASMRFVFFQRILHSLHVPSESTNGMLLTFYNCLQGHPKETRSQRS